MFGIKSISLTATLVSAMCLSAIGHANAASLRTNTKEVNGNSNRIAQNATIDPAPTTAGSQVTDAFKNLLNDTPTKTPDSTGTDGRPGSIPSRTVVLPILVENFVYVNGGVGRPEGDINTKVFNSFFQDNFGVLCGSSVTPLKPPVTCSATSAFSPDLTQADIDRIGQVRLRFNYAYKAPWATPPYTNLNSQLRVIVTNISNSQETFREVLPVSPGTINKTIDITKAILEGGPGIYGVRFVLVSPQSFPPVGESVAGFNNVAVTVSRRGIIISDPIPGPGPILDR